jgi:hypothetical protein
MPMEDPEYIRIKITDIPEEFILEYRLAGKDDINGWIYFEICRGCYGLPQAGILANNLLREQLEEEGYYKAYSTPGFGNTSGVQSNFASSRMTLALSTLASSISTTSPCS